MVGRVGSVVASALVSAVVVASEVGTKKGAPGWEPLGCGLWVVYSVGSILSVPFHVCASTVVPNWLAIFCKCSRGTW